MHKPLDPAIADIECGDNEGRSQGRADKARDERDNCVNVRRKEGQSVGKVHDVGIRASRPSRPRRAWKVT